MLIEFLYPAGISFIISLAAIPVIIYLSRRLKLFDTMSDRKIHTKPISRLGGLAIFLGFIVAFHIFVLGGEGTRFNATTYTLGLVVAFSAGFIDDLVNFRAWFKLILQVVAASLVAMSGLNITYLTIFDFGVIHFGYLSYVLTIIWIVGFMNAINLLDGMDGLASGVVLLATIFIFVIASIQNNPMVMTIAACLAGSIVGFYLFNFPPAKIFMGDGGAYLLGFMYSTISLMDIKKSAVATIFLIPLILLLVPIYDILSVMIKRYRLGYNIFLADKNHLHHRLISLGFSQKGILFIIYSYTIILGLLSVLLLYITPKLTLILFLLVVMLVFLSLYLLNSAERIIEKYEEESERKEGESKFD